MCTGAPRPAQRGWTLLALIVLLSVALLIIIGASLAVAAGWRATLMRAHQTKAFYLAHAGVMDAIAGYRSNTAGNWFGLGCFGNDPADLACNNAPNLNLGPGEVFIRPSTPTSLPQRDFLLVDTSIEGVSAVVTPQVKVGGVFTKSTFDNWELRRVVSNKTLMISALEVRWTGAVSAERVERVCLSAKWNDLTRCFTPSSPKQTGEVIDIPDFTLADNTTISNNHILFSVNLDTRPALLIVLTFFLADAGSCGGDSAYPSDAPTVAELAGFRGAQMFENCRRTALYADTDATNNWGLFTVRATGEYRAGPVTAARGLRAEYRAHASSAGQRSQVIAWQEQQPPLR